MSRCRSRSFYVAPGEVRYFHQHQLWTHVNGEWVRLTHRRDVERLAQDPTWDQVCYTFDIASLTDTLNRNPLHDSAVLEAAGPAAIETAIDVAPHAVERWRLDERLINGRRSGPEFVVASVVRHGASRAGGVRQVVTSLLGQSPASKDVISWFEASPPDRTTQAHLLRVLCAGSQVLDDAGMQSLVARLRAVSLPTPMTSLTLAMLPDLEFLNRYPASRRVRLLVDLFERHHHAEAVETLDMLDRALSSPSFLMRSMALGRLEELAEKCPSMFTTLADGIQEGYGFSPSERVFNALRFAQGRALHDAFALCQKPSFQAAVALSSPHATRQAALDALRNPEVVKAGASFVLTPIAASALVEHVLSDPLASKTHDAILMKSYALLAATAASMSPDGSPALVAALRRLRAASPRGDLSYFVSPYDATMNPPVLQPADALEVYQLVRPVLDKPIGAFRRRFFLQMLAGVEAALPENNAAAARCREILVEAAPVVRAADGFLLPIVDFSEYFSYQSPRDSQSPRGNELPPTDVWLESLAAHVESQERAGFVDVFLPASLKTYSDPVAAHREALWAKLLRAGCMTAQNIDPSGVVLEERLEATRSHLGVLSPEEASFRPQFRSPSWERKLGDFARFEQFATACRDTHRVLHTHEVPSAELPAVAWQTDPLFATVLSPQLRRTWDSKGAYHAHLYDFLTGMPQPTFQPPQYLDPIARAVTERHLVALIAEDEVEWPEKPKSFRELPTEDARPWSVPELARQLDGVALLDQEHGPLRIRPITDHTSLTRNASPNQMGNCTEMLAPDLRRGHTLLLALDGPDGPLFNVELSYSSFYLDPDAPPAWRINEMAGVSNAPLGDARRRYFLRVFRRLLVSAGMPVGDLAPAELHPW